MRVRLSKALGRCKALRPILAAKALPKQLVARVLRSCVFSGLIYGLHTLYYSTGWEHKLDAMQIRCLGRALGTKSTYAVNLIGIHAVTNQDVAEIAGWPQPVQRSISTCFDCRGTFSEGERPLQSHHV